MKEADLDLRIKGTLSDMLIVANRQINDLDRKPKIEIAEAVKSLSYGISQLRPLIKDELPKIDSNITLEENEILKIINNNYIQMNKKQRKKMIEILKITFPEYIWE